MKRLTLLTMLVAGVLLCCTSGAFAQSSSATFPISVAINNASTATFVIYQVDGGVFSPWTGTLAFNPDLTLVSDPGDPPAYAYLGDVYYAIDVFPYGAGALNVGVSYTDDSNPNGVINDGTGLGVHAIGTPVSNDNNGTPTNYNDDIETGIGTKAILGNIAQTIFASDILANGQYLRFYVGLATGNPLENEPTGAIPFNPGDTPGNYTGTLTMTVAAPGP